MSIGKQKALRKNFSLNYDEGANIVVYRHRLKFTDEFSMIFRKACLAIPKMGLTNTALNAFIFLLGNMDFENAILVTQKEIGASIGENGVKRQNVYSAMKELERHGVIVRGSKIANVNSYRLNRDVAWKGSVRNHKDNRRGILKMVPSPNTKPQVKEVKFCYREVRR